MKTGAPHGIRHGKATASWEEVEHCRTLHESGKTPRQIAEITGRSINTINDWIFYRTRCYA